MAGPGTALVVVPVPISLSPAAVQPMSANGPATWVRRQAQLTPDVRATNANTNTSLAAELWEVARTVL